MAMIITRHGYIVVTRDGVEVSRNTNIEEAMEDISIHADLHGNGTYLVTYPPRTVEVDGIPDPIVVPPPPVDPPADPPPPPPPTPPPPPPVPETAVLPKLLNFAETWSRNWNFEGHVVDNRFDGNYGNWDYTETTYEPWLFDRATVGYHLFQLTGATRWRERFLNDFEFYREHIDAQGIFTPKGFDDTKYSYITPFKHYETLTGDTQFRPIAQRIYTAWLNEWPATYSPSMAMWTEREIAFALEAAVTWYEMTNDPAALARANQLVEQWTTMANANGGAPQVSYTQHEGGGPGGTTPTNLTNSPWMSALYFQAARRLYDRTGNQEVLRQASDYFDWLNTNGFYDGALAHPEFAGLVFPRYLTGELIGDAGYDEGNMGHALDVAGFIKFAIRAKSLLNLSTDQARVRLGHMEATANRDFQNWTRTTAYLPKYRLSPPRKFNWWMRGYMELIA